MIHRLTFAAIPGAYQTTWGPPNTPFLTGFAGPQIIKPSTVTGIGTAKFTGSISGTTLTVASTQAGAVAIGEVLTDLSGAITSGTIITGNLTATTWTVTPSQTVASEAMIGSAYYVNNDPYWPALGEPPSRPNFSGNAFDFAYSVSSSLSPVAYHPTFTPFNGNNTNTTFLIEASFKSSGTIGTPQVVGGTQGGAFGAGFNFVGPDASGQDGPMRTKVTVPAASLIVVAILFSQGAVGTDVTSVTDSAGHTYTKAISRPSLGQPPR